MTTSDNPEPQNLWRLMDLATPMALRVAATLGVADVLAGGDRDAFELAERTGTDPDALRRVLSHLAHRGVFTETSPGTFALNATAELMRADHPSEMRLWLDLDGFGGRMDLAFTGLLESVRSGQPCWESVFGQPFWDYLAAYPEIGASFDTTMAAGRDVVEDATSGFDWPAAGHVVDVGGGKGVLVANVLRNNPNARATIVDLPATVERARQHLAEVGLADRCEFVGQSFFDPLPSGGDVYVLASILHDWPDDDATTILRRCAEAAGPAGRVVVIESHGSVSEGFTEMDLRMMVLLGGRERTIEDYTNLAKRAGLQVSGVHTTELDQIVVDCTPGRPG